VLTHSPLPSPRGQGPWVRWLYVEQRENLRSALQTIQALGAVGTLVTCLIAYEASASSKQSAYGKSIAAANQEADAINRSTIFKYATQGLQEQQIQNEGTIKEGQERLKLSGAEGEAAAAAGSGGVTGSSVRELYRRHLSPGGTRLDLLPGVRRRGEAEERDAALSLHVALPKLGKLVDASARVRHEPCEPASRPTPRRVAPSSRRKAIWRW
jgi:hypothetical protein